MDNDTPLYARKLTSAELAELLADDGFIARVQACVSKELGRIAANPLSSMIVDNIDRAGHDALLAQLPPNLAQAFRIPLITKEDGSMRRLTGEGLDSNFIYYIGGPAGFDPDRLTPAGSYIPLGPYFDLMFVWRDGQG